MKRKILSFIMAAAMTFSCVICASSFAVEAAEADLVLAGGNITADKGETVDFPVIIERNSGFATLNFYVRYSGDLVMGNPRKAVPEFTFTYIKTILLDYGGDYTETGDLVYIPFTIAEDAEYGTDYEIEILIVEGENYNYDSEEVLVETKSGHIVVTDPNAAPLVETPNVDHNRDATVLSSGAAEGDGWLASNLNNGKLEETGGFSTGGDGELWVGYDLGAVTRMNTVVLFSADSADERDANWSGIPKKFEIQTSDNGSDWTPLLEVDNGDQVPEKLKAYIYTFEETDARYVRILAVECYPKASEGGSSAIQLAEMQVRYSLLTGEVNENGTSGTITTEGIGAWTSVRKKGETFDMRFLLATTDVVLPGDLVTITFTTASGETRMVKRTVSDSAGDGLMALYESAVGAGIEYSAEDCRMFGCVIMDIPLNAFETASMTVTRDGLIVMKDAAVSYAKLGL